MLPHSSHGTLHLNTGQGRTDKAHAILPVAYTLSHQFMMAAQAMKALNYVGPFTVRVQEVERPRLEHPDDIIVKVTSAAICGSDLQ